MALNIVLLPGDGIGPEVTSEAARLLTRVAELYRGYRIGPSDPALALAQAALEQSGFPPRPVEVGGGADANVFRAQGIPCIVLANGMAEIHGPREHIAVADLEAMVRVTLELVECARRAA